VGGGRGLDPKPHYAKIVKKTGTRCFHVKRSAYKIKSDFYLLLNDNLLQMSFKENAFLTFKK